jgi:hypothetical protein
MDFDFDEYYKELTNTDLFAILDNAEAYQPLAVEAATKELNLRQLSQIQIEEARLPQLAAKLQKGEKIEKARVLREKMQTVGESIFSSVKQSDTKEDIINKIILWLVIVYCVYFLTSLPAFFRMCRDVFASTDDVLLPLNSIPFQFVLFLIPQLVLPIALLMFWKRKHTGWTLMVIYVTFIGTTDLTYLYRIFSRKQDHFYHNLFKTHITALDIFGLFIVLSTLYVLCRKDIRDIYKIDMSKMSGVIFVSTILWLIVILRNL